MLMFMTLLPVLFVVFRALLWSIFVRSSPGALGALRTVIIGDGPLVSKIASWLERIPGYELVETIPALGVNKGTGPSLQNLRLEDRIVADRLDMVLLSTTMVNGSKEYLENLCRKHGIHIKLIPPEVDVLLNRPAIDDLLGIPLVLSTEAGYSRGRLILKRGVDLIGAAILTIVLSPLLFLVALATKLESTGPVLFRQRRCLSGTDTVFDIYKFRSMSVQADSGKMNLPNESNGALFKLRQDPRVTRVGRFIRRYSIDELPQLINIFKGDMSLVGPRPLPVEDFDRLSEDDKIHSLYRHRSAMKPGLTGLWQISGRSDLGFREMILLDVYYIENHTHLFDRAVCPGSLLGNPPFFDNPSFFRTLSTHLSNRFGILLETQCYWNGICGAGSGDLPCGNRKRCHLCGY
jgi:lipopolysaccharide/colanic/teichoic acid biosynthesis glycosyltransferase